MKPTITVARTSKSKALESRLRNMGKRSVYVGIPASSARDRFDQLMKMAGTTPIVKKYVVKDKAGNVVYTYIGPAKITKRRAKAQKRLMVAAEKNINNAQLLFIFSRGSPRNNQPPRPVLEPAIEFPSNRARISAELGAAAKAGLEGRQGDVTEHLRRAGMAGRNAAQGWFTNPTNGWQQNAPSTIRRKLGKLGGKARKSALAVLSSVSGTMPLVGGNAALDEINTPGIDTGAMRQAITYVMGDESTPYDHQDVKNYAEEPKAEEQNKAHDETVNTMKAVEEATEDVATSGGKALEETAEGAAEIL